MLSSTWSSDWFSRWSSYFFYVFSLPGTCLGLPLLGLFEVSFWSVCSWLDYFGLVAAGLTTFLSYAPFFLWRSFATYTHIKTLDEMVEVLSYSYALLFTRSIWLITIAWFRAFTFTLLASTIIACHFYNYNLLFITCQIVTYVKLIMQSVLDFILLKLRFNSKSSWNLLSFWALFGCSESVTSLWPKSDFFSLWWAIFEQSDVTFWPSDVTLSEHPKMALFCAQKNHYLKTKFLWYSKAFVNDSL